MKKVILSLLTLGLFSTAVVAQVTNSDVSGNAPSGTGNGYTYLFNGNATENCLGSHVAGDNVGTQQTWTINETNHSLVMTVTGTQAYPGQVLRFYSANCVNSPINLSNAANQKVSFKATTSAACQLVVTVYNSAATQANNGDPLIISLAAGENTITGQTLTGMSGITNQDDILKVALVPRGTDGGYTSFSGTIEFEYFVIGDGTVPSTTGVNEQVNNNLISVYPNPAKDQISVDMSALQSSDAVVKVMNSNGAVVYEAKANGMTQDINTSSFNKGMYMVQVSSGNKVSNKKIVIE